MRDQEFDSRFQENILGFKIAVDQPSLLEDSESIQQLGSEDLDQLCTQPLELVLLDELIQVRGQTLEDEAKMVLVDERIP